MTDVLLLIFFLFACIVMSFMLYMVISVFRLYNFKNKKDARRKKAELYDN